jgi:hypothetical protein
MDNYEHLSYDEWLSLFEVACPTERKLWARAYRLFFGHWPQVVVDERLAFSDRMHRAALREAIVRTCHDGA